MIYDLTEIQKVTTYDRVVYYKRDDLFAPFGMDDVNGGKVRQTIHMFSKYEEYIHEMCNSTVICSVSVYSPTAPVISRVAKDFRFKCIVAVGGTKPETLDNHHMMRLAKHNGAEIRIVAGHGMSNAINAKVNKIVAEEKCFNTSFDKAIHDWGDEFMDVNSGQVKNIPDNIDTLVMSAGVGIQFACVLKGLRKYKKNIDRVIAVQIGPDRRKRIDSYFGVNSDGPLFGREEPYEYELQSYESAYGKGLDIMLHQGFWLDDLYEAKAHKWMTDNIEGDNVLFWCVGRRLREKEVNFLVEKGN